MKALALAIGLLLGLAFPAAAQDRGVDPAKVLAPYVDEFTYAIGVVDAKDIDLGAALSRLAKVGAPKDEIAQLKKLATQARDVLVPAGGRYICFTLNLADGKHGGPLLVVPIADGGNANKVAALIGSLPQMQTQVKDGTVLAGRKETLERALQRTPAASVFAAGLTEVNGLPIRAALSLPAALRNSIEESMPKLPKQAGGGPVTSVTRGFRWAAVGVDLSEAKFQLRAVVQAKDAAAAAELKRLAERFLELRLSEMKNEPPALTKAIEALLLDVRGDQLRLTLDSKQLDQTLLGLLTTFRATASRDVSINHLKQIGLAMHNYHDVYKSFPAQASFDAKKRPLLSWRVHLLPYLEQAHLYQQFKLDEPWDSPTNKALIAKMPDIYRSPLAADVGAGKTTYLVPAGPGLIFDGSKKTKIAQIRDGTSNTILVVDAAPDRAVTWTQPEDYAVDRKKPKAGLLVPNAAGFLAAFADGSVRFMSRAITDEAMWLYFCPDDDMPIPADQK